MREQLFDDLAKGLDDGTISRRRALKLAGGALLAAVVPSVFPPEAQALSRRRRCRRKGGLFLPSADPNSPCRCTNKCTRRALHCHNNSSCLCYKNIDGAGFCGQTATVQDFCSSSLPCPAGSTCVLVPAACCGSACTTSAQCGGACDICTNGKCQRTVCVEPCPP